MHTNWPIVFENLNIDRRMPGELSPACILRFLSRVHEEYFPNLALEYDLVTYSEKLSSKANAIVAYKNRFEDELLGGAFGYCNNLENREAYLSFFGKVLVSPKGLATMLHREFCIMAQEAGMRTIALEVRKTNLHAIEFYNKAGYMLCADHGTRNLMSMQIPSLL